jgi:hypothetical protein
MRPPGAAEHRGFDQGTLDDFQAVFAEAIAALENGGLPYVLIGGLASSVVGRPRCSADVDVLVRPRDAGRALELLRAAGFETEETNPNWLYKATRNGVLVDLIFKAPRDAYLDDEMLSRSRVAEVLGQKARIAPPEDLLLMKCLIHDEETPRHWHDALGIIAKGGLDWEYLLRRSRSGSRRLLSLLLYALSLDLLVPSWVVQALYDRIFFGDEGGA